MPVSSVATMNQILDAWLGTTRAAGTPDSYDVELWIDDPRSDTPTEADWDGYAAVSLDSDDWLAADGGAKSTASPVDFGAPASAGSDAVRYFALRDPDTSELAFSAPLTEPFRPPEGGGDNNVFVTPTVYVTGS